MGYDFTVLGIGDLIFDHVFVKRGGQLVYSHGAGGGSVFNILANLQVNTLDDTSASAVGVGGSDDLGRAALEELHLGGIDTEQLLLIPRRRTQVVFEIVDGARPAGREQHRFTLACPICGSTRPVHRAAAIWERHTTIVPNRQPCFVCVDRISRSRVDACQRLRAEGVITVLDLGRRGFIRYRPIAEVISALKAFNIVLLPQRVASALVKRAGVESASDFLNLGIDVMLVSMGNKGLHLLGRPEGAIHEVHIDAPDCGDVVDDAGAGDALLAYFMKEVWRHGGPEGPKVLDWVTLTDATARCVRALRPVLLSIGARGHLQSTITLRQHVPTDQWRNVNQSVIFESVVHLETCPFCGTKGGARPEIDQRSLKPYGARRNVRDMAKRILFAVEHPEALKGCKELLKASGTAYIVGTGGSFAVAEFWSMVLGEHGSLFTRPVKPMEYLRSGKRSDVVVVISYSGRTPDCERVVHRAHALGVGRVVLVTGVPEPSIGKVLKPESDRIISYGRLRGHGGFGRERGFVSISGTVSPCALITGAVKGQLPLASLSDRLGSLERARCHGDSNADDDSLIASARRFAKAIKASTPEGGVTESGAAQTQRIIAVFGGGWAWPAVIDCESKFTEAKLAVAQLHEVKDFSHGRFISLLSDTTIPALFIGVSPLLPYENELIRIISKGRVTMEVVSVSEGVVGGLETLATMQYVIELCGDELARDISRPDNIPEAGLRLYKWQDGVSPSRRESLTESLFE
jgi:sugar/nucleoside kinase (ribokinase family)